MRKLSTVAVAATAALALTMPVAAVAAPTVPTGATTLSAVGTASVDSAALRAKKKIKLTKAKEGTHFGLAGNTITAKVRGKGKVKFTLNGDLLKKSKIKKGKAKVTLPATLAPGTYKVKAKFKKAKGSIKTVVWDSALNVNAATFTVSASQETPWIMDMLTGTVKYKGKIATEGWVDVYLNGDNKGGSTSPTYVDMSSVTDTGTFSFSSYDLLDDAKARGIGTHQYKAFYTETSSFDEYIYSQWITVTVTP